MTSASQCPHGYPTAAKDTLIIAAPGSDILYQTDSRERNRSPSPVASTADALNEIPLEICTLSGRTLEILPVPATILGVKAEIESEWGTPVALQKLLSGSDVLDDDAVPDPHGQQLTFVLDESPLFYWDIIGNPRSKLLRGHEGTVTFDEERVDYVNVITREPITSGVHFFEFVMHNVQDEQWCGLTDDTSRAGYRSADRGWFYYSGRQLSLRANGMGALHAPRERVIAQVFTGVRTGDTIGLLVDMEREVAVFSLNDVVQGGCRLPQKPLYLTTSLDVQDDCVELRKPSLTSASQELFNTATDLCAKLPRYKEAEPWEEDDVVHVLPDSDSDSDPESSTDDGSDPEAHGE